MGRRTRGILMIVLGLLLSFSAAGIYARYEQQAVAASANAQTLLQEVKVQMKQRELTAVTLEAPENQTVQLSVEGHGVMGILLIEKAGIQLPVMGNWNYENLEYGPCRYSGSLETGDLVLLGHNYAGHLADLDVLTEGDTIELMDVAGKRHLFSVAKTENIAPTAVEAVTASEYPLTVFTCTPGGQSRYVVYCNAS